MKTEQVIARLSEQLPDTPAGWIELACRLQYEVLAHDPGNADWPRADALIGAGEPAIAAEKAAALAGQKPHGYGELDSLLARSHGKCVVLADAASSAGLVSFAGKDARGKLVVLSQAACPPSGWHAVPLGKADRASLAAVVNAPPARVWTQVTIDGASPKPAESADPAQLLDIGGGLPHLAERMGKLGTETAFAVLAQVNALRAEGKDIITFGLGEPDFDTPAHIKQAAKAAIDDNQTHYGSSQGLPALREQCAAYISRTRGIPVTPENIAVGPGAKPIIFDVMMTLINPGDEVIYPNPGYPIYESVIDWIGGVSVPVPLLEEKNWSMDVDELARLITPRTKALFINSPQNPTGGVIPPADLDRIAALAVKHNLWVISDEVYSQICFGAPFDSIASRPDMPERTVIIEGHSKTYAMTGWRLGYGVMHPELARRVARIETNIDSCTCTFTQIAGVAAIAGPQDESIAMAGQFEARGKHITDRLNEIEGVSCRSPGGAFYVFPNVTGACAKLGLPSARELCDKLLHEAGVAVLPRTCFGRKNTGETDEFIRLSYATGMELIDAGLDRMKAYMERGEKAG